MKTWFVSPAPPSWLPPLPRPSSLFPALFFIQFRVSEKSQHTALPPLFCFCFLFERERESWRTTAVAAEKRVFSSSSPSHLPCSLFFANRHSLSATKDNNKKRKISISKFSKNVLRGGSHGTEKLVLSLFFFFFISSSHLISHLISLFSLSLISLSLLSLSSLHCASATSAAAALALPPPLPLTSRSPPETTLM